MIPKITLPLLPYPKGALQHISKETIELHYSKHHQSYVDNLNKLLPGTNFEGKSLKYIVENARGGMFNFAAQIWNHDFYWNSMSPEGGEEPPEELRDILIKNFGSVNAFKEEFTKKAVTFFGSGWCWLVQDKSKELSIITTRNALTPFTSPSLTPLLTCDVWEHAYYMDYQNKRPDYLKAFWKVVNWDFILENMKHE